MLENAPSLEPTFVLMRFPLYRCFIKDIKGLVQGTGFAIKGTEIQAFPESRITLVLFKHNTSSDLYNDRL